MRRRRSQILKQSRKPYKELQRTFLEARDARGSPLKYTQLVLGYIPYNYSYIFSAALVLLYKLLPLLNILSFNLINIIGFIKFNNTIIVL